MASKSGTSLSTALGVTAPELGSSVTIIKSGERNKDPVTKAEGDLLRSNSLNIEDGAATAFDAFSQSKLIKPTYDPFLLGMLTHQNNTLMQCIDAMEVNIDGTGFEIEREDGEPITDAEKPVVEGIKQFFNEVYPGESFVTQRRKLRRDMESTGCGYLEVIRTEAGDVAFTRRLDAKLMRMVALDAPVVVEREVQRMGKTVTTKMVVRERRFCMQVGTSFRFFKEFDASRDVHMLTGAWLDESGKPIPGTDVVQPHESKANTQGGNPLATSTNLLAIGNTSGPTAQAPEETVHPKGTEVIMLTAIPDNATGYGVPRWINQIPSVLGSRKAEEFNLEFFNAGGLPPAIILVQGGQLTPDSKRDLTNYLAGKAKFKQRGVIAEIFSAGGSLDGAGSGVKVTVERFGDERQKDSMFGNYDDRCADHVRRAFRLPPLFIGNSKDHNFATAMASYMVAEAQVFRPEREEFDEIINIKLMKKLAPGYLYRSLPMVIHDAEQQLKAMELAKDLADPEEFLKTINELVSVTLTPKENIGENEALGLVRQMLGQNPVQPSAPGKEIEAGDGQEVVKVEADSKGLIQKLDDDVLVELSSDWTAHLTGAREFEPASVAAMQGLIKALSPTVRALFNQHVAAKMTNSTHDVQGTADLISCAATALGTDCS